MEQVLFQCVSHPNHYQEHRIPVRHLQRTIQNRPLTRQRAAAHQPVQRPFLRRPQRLQVRDAHDSLFPSPFRLSFAQPVQCRGWRECRQPLQLSGHCRLWVATLHNLDRVQDLCATIHSLGRERERWHHRLHPTRRRRAAERVAPFGSGDSWVILLRFGRCLLPSPRHFSLLRVQTLTLLLCGSRLGSRFCLGRSFRLGCSLGRCRFFCLALSFCLGRRVLLPGSSFGFVILFHLIRSFGTKRICAERIRRPKWVRPEARTWRWRSGMRNRLDRRCRRSFRHPKVAPSPSEGVGAAKRISRESSTRRGCGDGWGVRRCRCGRRSAKPAAPSPSEGVGAAKGIPRESRTRRGCGDGWGMSRRRCGCRSAKPAAPSPSEGVGAAKGIPRESRTRRGCGVGWGMSRHRCGRWPAKSDARSTPEGVGAPKGI